MESAPYILKEYLKYHNENIIKYGKNTVVLMQVGGFYEIYAVINEKIHEGADIYHLADILGIQVARRNKNIPEIDFSNFLMAGWNTFALSKFQKILLNHNYTIVLVNQITEPPNIERQITDIISPGTILENNLDTNYLVSVTIFKYPQQYDKNIYVIGLSSIDVSTGENIVHRIQSSLNDENIWKDELFRLIHYYSPKEILFHYDDDIKYTKEELCNLFSLDMNSLYLNLYKDSQFKKPSFQNAFFDKMFKKENSLTSIEYLGFERELEITLSYIYMIQFVYEHKLENTMNLPKPIYKTDNKNLILSHNCIYQLYLIPNREHEDEKYNSLLSILNKCDTAIGRRLCKQRLLYPILDIDLICEKLDKYIDHNKKDLIKKDHNEKYGFFIYVTDNRAKIFKKSIGNLVNTNIRIGDISVDLTDIKFVKRGSNTHIEFDIFNNLSNKLVSDQLKIQNLNKKYYIETIQNFYNKYKKLFDELVSFIGFIDLNCNLAKLSIEYSYSKPEIVNSGNSQLVAKDIRHPIVERIQTEIEYVPNDVSLNENGILLFGTNACGKSTLMKSIGLTLIMAQAGFFVSCKNLKYTPYTQIFTRILNNDNIFKRQSSFAVEMSELRGILKRANKNSLVLGDELCSGTETTSALSIVSAGLKTLTDLKCSFIFTSHLHQLMNIDIIKNNKSLQIYHLKIEYDSIRDILIYQRKLEKGSGPAIYGLEVCKSLDLGNEFISLARNIQLSITDSSKTLVNDKISNYNAEILMDKCQICSKNSEHTHHIKEQNTADDNNMIDHHHKNINHNLVQLCESCHHKVHHENLRIYGYIKTDKGIQLNYEYVKKEKVLSKKKFNKEQIDIILSYRDDIDKKRYKKSDLLKKLELEKNIKISSNTLNKIFTNDY